MQLVGQTTDKPGKLAPSADELIARAKAMIPALASRAEDGERNRRLPAETIADIKQAGLVRALQPARWGGYELHPADFAEIAIALGEGDLCVGWVYGIYAGHAFHLGFFDDQAQADVWGENQDAMIASSYAPGGRAEPTPGGYRFSGRWRFSSGSNDSDWVMVGGVAADAPTELQAFLVPRKDYQVIDTWHVMGLRGTGSNDILIEDVFVPAHRLYKFSDGFHGRSPSTSTEPLFNVPPLQVFYRGLTNASIGALQAMLNEYAAFAIKKASPFGGMVGESDAQFACGLAANAISEMRTLLHADMERLMDCARRGTMPSLEERLAGRYRAGEVAERCVNAAKLMFEAAGGSALFESQPLGRIYRNLQAARQHVGVQHRAFSRALGAHLFNLPTTDVML